MSSIVRNWKSTLNSNWNHSGKGKVCNRLAQNNLNKNLGNAVFFKTACRYRHIANLYSRGVLTTQLLNIGYDHLLFWYFFLFADESQNSVYYINTSEIPSELSRENFISSHVKITCYLHTWRDHHGYDYITNRAFFTGVYIRNRILHARLWNIELNTRR